MFKKVTGINFTDYLSRVRIEKSKNLLLNPNLRVSECGASHSRFAKAFPT